MIRGKKHDPDEATKKRWLDLRREFTAQLFMREGLFWELVSATRPRWLYTADAPRQLPPPTATRR